ncbi:MAG: trigger factor [Bacteroidetes bacterium]|nr:trigger factor [Bacteroidota bacterium]
MKLTVESLNSVDKEIILSATREDLTPRFEKALKNIRKKANIPGFRVGQAPMQLIRKRFGKDVEADEINDYIQEIFREQIVTEHKPVGEPKITDMKWENDQLEVTFKVGVKPEFELVDVSTLKADKLVHDVSDDEVQKEMEYALVRNGSYADSDEAIEENSKITADVEPLDDHGHGTAIESDQEIDLSEPDNESLRKDLVGKKPGETVEVEMAHGDHSHKYKLTIKTHQKLTKAEMNEEFIKKATQDEAATEDEYKTFLKSRIQNYFDETSRDLFKEAIAEVLVNAHDFEVPESMIDLMVNQYFEDYKQRAKGQVPDDFNMDEFRNASFERARNEAKWMFIMDALMEKYPELEITPEDADNFMQAEAAKYGLTVDMIKQFYSSSTEQLENLRQNLRSQKLFDKLTNEIGVNELDKEAYQNRNK